MNNQLGFNLPSFQIRNIQKDLDKARQKNAKMSQNLMLPLPRNYNNPPTQQ